MAAAATRRFWVFLHGFGLTFGCVFSFGDRRSTIVNFGRFVDMSLPRTVWTVEDLHGCISYLLRISFL